MINKKNLNNLGFTLYEVLAVMAIIGLILGVSLPVGITSYKEYKQLIFKEKCLVYEKSFLDVHNKFSFNRKGTTSLTNGVYICVPFSNKIETEEDKFVDILDLTLVEYFIYETLVVSNFNYDDFRYEYTPAVLTKAYTYSPSTFTLYLKDEIIIKYNLRVLTSRVGANQMALFSSVEISQGDFAYMFNI